MELTLTEAKSYKFIQVRLYGHAHVHWTERHSRGGNRGTEIINYTGNEAYVDLNAVLWKSVQTPKGKIGPGSFRFPFQFTIPPNCPSSYHGSVGYIQYYVTGHIGTGLFKFDRHINAPIQVCKIININQPQLLAPVRQTVHKQVCCLCCASGNIDLTINLPRSGFCINGDRIPLSVAVENGSGRRIVMRAEISKQITYSVKGNHRYNKSIITQANSEAILPHSSSTWSPENFIIPAVETSLCASQMISIKYILRIWAVVPFAFNPSVVIPIVLGNVPYQGSSETAIAAPRIDFTSFSTTGQIPVAT